MTWYRCSGGSGMPSGLQTSMDAVLNKKFGTSTTYPATGWPDDVNLLGPLPEKTASGAIAHFDDGADDVPLRSWLVTLGASLSGYSAVKCVGASANIFDGVLESGWIDNSGTDSPTSGRTRSKNYLPIKGGESYYVTCSDSWRVYFYDSTQTFISYAGTYSANRVITAPNNAVYFRFAIIAETPSGVGLNYPSTDTTAHTATGPTVQTANLGRTIYGGSVDVVNGTGTSTHKYYTAADVTGVYWNNRKADQVDTNHRATFRIATESGYLKNTNSLCNELTYNSNITGGSGYAEGYQIANGGIYFCIDLADIGMSSATSDTPNQDFIDAIQEYGDNLKFSAELATATDFTFTPISVNSKLGTNNLWTDEGSDNAVTYRADIQLALGGN